MRTNRNRWRYGLAGCGLVLALAAATTATRLGTMANWSRPRNPLEQLVTVPVRRVDLKVTTTAGGRVDSATKTVIECQIERMGVGVQGRGMAGGGASTILSIVPDGSAVKRGEVLCVLDASEYEELARTQAINVVRVRSDHRQAELDAEAARMALGEFRDGLMKQTRQSLEGEIALARSLLEGSKARLAWVERMVEKGYVPRGQLSGERYNLLRSTLELVRGESELGLFEKFTAPTYLRILEGDVVSADQYLGYQTHRLNRHEERLRSLRRQVERCTIRAPHDGVVIYASEQMTGMKIEPGLTVHQKQRLFYLPDLSQMEVEARLHESVVPRIRPGMLARVRVESLSNRTIEGHVVSISQLPATEYSQHNPFGEIKNFIGVVKLDNVPRGLLPGMTAEVEIQTGRLSDVLTIPPEALAVEQGREVCYVARDDRIERREVKVGQESRGLLEVTEGLGEGEAVVLDPAGLSGQVAVASGAPAVPDLGAAGY
jgi:HlyD family secretion protein